VPPREIEPSAEVVLVHEAPRLLLDRARLIVPEFRMTADNATAAAVALAVGQAGLASTQTIVLLTPEEVDAASKKAVPYRPPGG
jgi:hypothetical protein